MRILLGYLWKEWRDHRVVLVGMAVAVPLLMTVAGLALPSRALDNEAFAPFVALACLAIFVVSLATDLVPGERRRGHLRFLERLPAGLNAAFASKLALFMLGGALFLAYGFAAGALTSRLVAGTWPRIPDAETQMWVLAIAALWTFAVSCALPRGALSVPAVAALALLLAVPAIVLFKLWPSRGPAAWWRWETGALWTAGGLVAGWAAFRRAGAGLRRAGPACLAVGAVCALPYWADAAHDAYVFEVHAVTELQVGWLGDGGRYALFNRLRVLDERRMGPLPPVAVDLRTGETRELGGAFDHVYPTTDWHQSRGMPVRYVWVGDTILDTRTAGPAQPGEAELRAASRAASTWRLADGRRVWAYGDKLEADAPGGGFEALGKWQGGTSAGLGVRSWNDQAFWDLVRGRRYSTRDLGLRSPWVMIRPRRWLVGRSGGASQLFDPDTKTFSPVQGMEAKDHARAVLDDGRVIVTRGERSLLLDPESGAVTDLALPDGFLAFEPAEAFGRMSRTPDGRRVIAFWTDGGRILARFDPPASLAMTALVTHETRFLGCPTDDEAIVHDDHTVWRLRFGSGQREVIYRTR